MSNPSPQALLLQLHSLARDLLRRWPVQVDSLQLVNHGENTIYDVKATGGARYILRLHRPGYQSDDAIRTELAWLRALRRDTDLQVPEPVPGHDGHCLQAAHSQALPEGRRSVLFVRQPGAIVGKHAGVSSVRQLGALLARLHQHSQRRPIDASARARLDAPGWVGPSGVFGDPLAVPLLTEPQRQAMAQARQRLLEELAQYGEGPSRFGLIHADLHTHNVLRHQGRLIPIDFDDCAQSYWMVDLVVVHRSLRLHKNYERLILALRQGYQEQRSLSAEDLAVLPSLTMMSMLVGIAWLYTRLDLPWARGRLESWIEVVQLACRLYQEGKDPLKAEVQVTSGAG